LALPTGFEPVLPP